MWTTLSGMARTLTGITLALTPWATPAAGTTILQVNGGILMGATGVVVDARGTTSSLPMGHAVPRTTAAIPRVI